MQIKAHPPVTVLYSTHQVTIKQLGELGQTIKDLYAEASKNDVFVSGPLYFIYHGADGNPNTLFTLEIAVPVQGKINSTRFQVKQLQPFQAITYQHDGPFEQLPETYTQIMKYVDGNKIPLNDECRELYFNIDFENPENNITQVQIGVYDAAFKSSSPRLQSA